MNKTTVTPAGFVQNRKALKRVFLFLFLLSGCSTVTSIPDASKFYRRELSVEVGGKKFNGLVVLPKGSQYDFKIESKGEINFFTMTSCHREVSRDPDNGIFNKKKVEIQYKPTKNIEDVGSCALEFGAYNKDKGKNGWAFVDFENDENKSKAVLKCNGEISSFNGVGVCQSREGLLQEIGFMETMRISPEKACDTFDIHEGKNFQFTLSKGICVYAFLSKSGLSFRLTTIGYEAIILE